MAKATKAADLRKLTNQQLVEQIDEAREQLMRMRFQKATGELKDQNAPRAQRRKIAQLMTILNEKGAAPAPAGDKKTEGEA
ncbi:MAG: 50S ribosomal protein L29 [Anaerolineales bacterium]|nr:50S ribosomal protein L29 [Anaerolineales bacterium]QYK50022.1 MAG: 50S ribosomal protein L29 [Anaerolineales bacterium]